MEYSHFSCSKCKLMDFLIVLYNFSMGSLRFKISVYMPILSRKGFLHKIWLFGIVGMMLLIVDMIRLENGGIGDSCSNGKIFEFVFLVIVLGEVVILLTDNQIVFVEYDKLFGVMLDSEIILQQK